MLSLNGYYSSQIKLLTRTLSLLLEKNIRLILACCHLEMALARIGPSIAATHCMILALWTLI